MNPDRMYDLAAVVVHCGTGINRGHYFAIVKSHRFWLLFDDDLVDVCKCLHMGVLSKWRGSVAVFVCFTFT